MEWTKAMHYVKDQAEQLRKWHDTASRPEPMRTVYYYYGLICLAALEESKQPQEMADEIRTVKAVLQAMGFHDLKKYASNFYHRIRSEYGISRYETADEIIQEAEGMASRTTGILEAYHLFGCIMKRRYIFAQPVFIQDFDDGLGQDDARYYYYIHLYKNEEYLGHLMLKCSTCDLVLGRGENSSLIIRQQGLSRSQVLLRLLDGSIIIRDPNFESGTYVYGQKIKTNSYVCFEKEACFRLGASIEVRVEAVKLSEKQQKKCELCGTNFITSDPDQEFCFSCRRKMEKQLGVQHNSQIPYIENDYFNALEFVCKQMYGPGVASKTDFTSEGSKMLVWTKPYVVSSKATPPANDAPKPEAPPKPAVQPKPMAPPKPEKISVPESTLLERCIRGKKIGEGGMGVVYQAEDKYTHHQYALKMIKRRAFPPGTDPKIIQKIEQQSNDAFIRESKLHMQFKHKHVAAIYEVGQAENAPYIIMELYKDGTLLDYYTKIANHPKKYELMRKILIQILEGLDYLHTTEVSVELANKQTEVFHGIVHRDLKPGNIFVAYDAFGNPEMKIADFGMAKSFEAAGLSGVTKSNMVGGTYIFMPRQQLSNFKYCKPEVDIWAAVASIYCLLTGRPPKPFKEGEPPATTAMLASAVPIRTYDPKCPRSFAKIIDRALDDQRKDDTLFYQSARELIKDLEKLKC